jgi:hypothetical protein
MTDHKLAAPRPLLKILDNYRILPASRCLLIDLAQRGNPEFTAASLYDDGFAGMGQISAIIRDLRIHQLVSIRLIGHGGAKFPSPIYRSVAGSGHV